MRAPGAADGTSARAGIPDNEEQSTGMEQKEEQLTPDIFWTREPIMGHRGTKENPAIVPSFNDNRVVGLETEQGVIWFRLCKGPLHKVAGQYFKCAPASRKPTHAPRRARADLSARPRAAQAAAARRRRPPLSGAGHVRPPLTECATEPLAASIRKQVPPSRGARAQQGPSASLYYHPAFLHALSGSTSYRGQLQPAGAATRQSSADAAQ